MKLLLSATLALYSLFSLAAVELSGNPQLKFTGYKFSEPEKVGVSGTFKKITWNIPQSGTSIQEIIRKSSAEIDTYSIDAGNAARNSNITRGLFKTWGAQNVSGVFKDVTGKSATLHLTVGEKTVKIPMTLTKKDKEIKLVGVMDLLKLGFGDAFKSLSDVCGPNHKGKDGVTKTWSEVDLEITAALK